MTHTARKVLLIVLAAASCTACLTNTQTNTLQSDIEQLRSRFEVLQQEHATILDRIARQAEEVRAVVEATGQGDEQDARLRAELFTRLDSMQREMGVLLEKLDDTNFRLSALSGDIQATRSMFSYGQMPQASPSGPAMDEPVSPAPLRPSRQHPPASTAGPGGAAPQEIYNTAYADYTKGNYPLAILGFQEYLERFAGSDFADDALYWVGESYFSQGKFTDAVQAFEEVIRRYPQGDKVPAAHLKKGLAYLESNRTAQAVVQLSALVENYPDSDEARLARERLRSMGLRDR